MPTSNINPSTVSNGNPSGTAYAAGPWNTAGLDNLSSTPVAANAVLIAANPGTGLSRLNKGDTQWLQTTGRLVNGLQFNIVTRDADLGQRPSFANRDRNRRHLGGGRERRRGYHDYPLRQTCSTHWDRSDIPGKSSDTEVNYTIAQSRMAAGVLALTSTIAEKSYQPVRSLDIDFNDLSDPKLPSGATDDSQFISANLNTISSYQYQAVLLGYVTTVKAPNSAALAAYESVHPGLSDAQAWAQLSSFNPANPSDPTVSGIKGDTTGDVAKFLTNMLNSQGSYQTLTTANDPADAFLSNSYLLPNLLANSRDPSTGMISANPNYDPDAFAKAQAIYDNGATSKFNANKASSFGKDIETTGSGANYGSVVSGGLSPSNFNGNVPITALNADGTTAADGTLAPRGNWLFGNFNQNGVRDLSAVQSALAAAKALWNAEPAGTTGANSAFNVSSGQANAANSTPVTYTDVNGVSHTMTKGDLIVMGDYLSLARFDGASLAALARGAAASDAGGAGYAAGAISGGQASFADALRNAVLRKNDALNFLQTNTADAKFSQTVALNASAFIRQSAHAVLTEPGVTTTAGVPAHAFPLSVTDPNSGLELFTYDFYGTYSFDKHDVNRDGVVDFNDALLVDQFNGQNTANLSQQLAATEQTPVTGVVQSISLTSVQQIDNEASIGTADTAELNAGLTGTGNTNWYGFAVTKSGPTSITWARTGGTVTLYPGAAFQISAGTVTVTSPVDPFSDSSATGIDTSKSLAVTLTSGGTLRYAAQSTSSSPAIQLERLAGLNIGSGAQVTLDPAAKSSARMLLITGALSVNSAKLDLGNNDLIVQHGNLSALQAMLTQGYNVGAWNGVAGITSISAASDFSHLTTLGILLNNRDGSTPLFGTGTPLGLFDGISPSPSDVLIKYTYYGDANLDGKVDGSDYSRIDSGFLAGAGTNSWFNGDFNYDGVINGADYTLLDNAFNQQGAALTAQIAAPASSVGSVPVPEPIGLSGTAMVGMGLLSRRRRNAGKDV